MSNLLSNPAVLPAIGTAAAGLASPLIKLMEPLVGWLKESWRDTDPGRIESSLEENFLRRLFAIRRDYAHKPILLRKKLTELLRQYRMVPQCVTSDMTLDSMIDILTRRTRHNHVERFPYAEEAPKATFSSR